MTLSIIEVGPRDGLQNVSEIIPTQTKINLIQYLLDKGFQDIEAGSFVHPKKVPQMADTEEIANHFKFRHSNLWYLTPNLRGLKHALDQQCTQLAFFTSASDGFNKKNIGMSTLESIDMIHECVEFLRDNNYHIVDRWEERPQGSRQIKLRLYISTVIACPYDGRMNPEKTVGLMEELVHLGFAQTSLGDTIGVGVPSDWKWLLAAIDEANFPKNKLAMHCHNTYGTALASIYEGLNLGVTAFDSSIGGLGGCPFAPGAAGNLPTEELLYFLNRQGYETPVKVETLLDCFSQERTGTLVNRSSLRNALKK